MTQEDAEDLERRRTQIVLEMTQMLHRMARGRAYLTTGQRYLLAETLRDVADEMDRGKIVRPHPLARHALRRLVPAFRRNGELLYRIL